MRIKANQAIIISLIILFGGIFITSALGLYKTSGTQIPVKFTSGEYAGQYNPEDIKGSYTFGDIEEYFNVPAQTLGNAFGITENPSAFQVKNLEATDKGSTSAVRFFVAAYNGMNITGIEKSPSLPETAVTLLLTEGHPTAEQKEILRTLSQPKTTPGLPKADGTGSGNGDGTGTGNGTGSGTGNGTGNGSGDGSGSGSNSDSEIRGKTTFAEAMAMGISKEKIESVIKGSIPDTSMTIRDYCKANNLEFSEVREALAQP